MLIVGVILWNHSKSQTTTYISIDEPVKNVPLFADSGSAPAPEPVPASVPAAEPSPAAPAPAPVPAPAAVPAQPAAPAVVSAPAPAAPAPAPAAPAKPLQKPDFAKILQHLKKSAFAEAEAELNRGFGMNTSPEDSLRLQRLENVHKFAKFFFEDIEKALERYQPPTEFCDGKYVLVETGKRSAVLHIGGKNVRFTMAEPNSGGQNLFAILYEHRYGDALSKGNTVPAIGYASFLLLSFPNEKAKAVQLLNQAKTAGAEKNRKIAEDILLELGK